MNVFRVEYQLVKVVEEPHISGGTHPARYPQPSKVVIVVAESMEDAQRFVRDGAPKDVEFNCLGTSEILHDVAVTFPQPKLAEEE